MTKKLPNKYLELPSILYKKTSPTAFVDARFVLFNDDLAEEFGITKENFHGHSTLAVFSGCDTSCWEQPLSLAYAGHQFGHFVPQLGDGRAHLLGQVVDKSGQAWDIQLKGSGHTPFSRGGDGKSRLGPALREYVMSEAMHGLGIATTRTLAVIRTGETVQRERVVPGGLSVRVARSHLRVGTFEFLMARQDIPAMDATLNFVIENYYPELISEKNKALSLLNAIIKKQATLVATWMGVGFIHGVMNTDNVSIIGDTIDYGPCAFMNTYDLQTVYSSIDHENRYAYGNQANAMKWNLSRLAQAMLPLFDTDYDKGAHLATELLEGFDLCFKNERRKVFSQKLGNEQRSDVDIDTYLLALAQDRKDGTLTFRQTHGKAPNPLYIPRNHWGDRAIREAEEDGDTSLIQELTTILKSPFSDQKNGERFAKPPGKGEDITATFCGT
jgi:serine/tyrosine/threonine adenylyltransferase